jgi:anti-sigma B factor antagonist
MHTSQVPTTGRQLLQVTVETPAPATTLITVVGEIDAMTVPGLADVLLPHPAAAETVVVDLSGVGFIGTTGLSVLVHAQRRAITTGGKLKLVTGPHCVRRALEMTGLYAEFACYPDLTGALAT